MYKEALQKKLRFTTGKGNLTTEDLFDLNLEALDNLALTLDKMVQESPRKSFIKVTNPKSEILELKLEIVKDVINTKLQKAASKAEAKDKAAKKAQLVEILARKQAQSLEDLSEEELKKRIAELSI